MKLSCTPLISMPSARGAWWTIILKNPLSVWCLHIKSKKIFIQRWQNPIIWQYSLIELSWSAVGPGDIWTVLTFRGEVYIMCLTWPWLAWWWCYDYICGPRPADWTLYRRGGGISKLCMEIIRRENMHKLFHFVPVFMVTLSKIIC